MRLVDLCNHPGLLEAVRAREPGEARADDDDLRLGRGVRRSSQNSGTGDCDRRSDGARSLEELFPRVAGVGLASLRLVDRSVSRQPLNRLQKWCPCHRPSSSIRGASRGRVRRVKLALRGWDGCRLTLCDGKWYKRLELRSAEQHAGRGAVSLPRHVDAVDKAIIEALQKNGREAFRRIAAEVGVSEATIRARYARLCDDNILQVTGITNPLGLGFDAQAMVGIRTAGAPEPVADEIAKWDEADYVVVTAGQFDLLVELVCENRRHLLDLTNRIRALDGVVSTESFLYLELWKQLYDWGARADEAALAEAR